MVEKIIIIDDMNQCKKNIDRSIIDILYKDVEKSGNNEILILKNRYE